MIKSYKALREILAYPAREIPQILTAERRASVRPDWRRYQGRLAIDALAAREGFVRWNVGDILGRQPTEAEAKLYQRAFATAAASSLIECEFTERSRRAHRYRLTPEGAAALAALDAGETPQRVKDPARSRKSSICNPFTPYPLGRVCVLRALKTQEIRP